MVGAGDVTTNSSGASLPDRGGEEYLRLGSSSSFFMGKSLQHRPSHEALFHWKAYLHLSLNWTEALEMGSVGSCAEIAETRNYLLVTKAGHFDH